jgi:hypothetical protein
VRPADAPRARAAREMLRGDRGGLKKAFLLREILDGPRALRGRSRRRF